MATTRSSWRANSSSATRRSTVRRPSPPRPAQSPWAARARTTTASMPSGPSTVVVNGVVTGSNSRPATTAIRDRTDDSVGSISGWFANVPSLGSLPARLSTSRRGRSPTSQRWATAERKASA